MLKRVLPVVIASIILSGCSNIEATDTTEKVVTITMPTAAANNDTNTNVVQPVVTLPNMGEYVKKSDVEKIVNDAVAKALANSANDNSVVIKEGERGKDGKDGRGIEATAIDQNGYLIIKYTDGTLVNVGMVKGEKGDPGIKGDKGDSGAQGEKGEQGQPGLTGAKGDTGEKGEQGIAGEKGDTGSDESHNWENGTELINHYAKDTYESAYKSIFDVSVSKNHCDKVWNDKHQTIEYIIKMTGKLKNYGPDAEGIDYRGFNIVYYNSSTMNGYEKRSYFIGNYESGKIIPAIEIINSVINEDGTFVFECKQYDVYGDYDSFQIEYY